jgi:hypothetical protein
VKRLLRAIWSVTRPLLTARVQRIALDDVTSPAVTPYLKAEAPAGAIAPRVRHPHSKIRKRFTPTPLG